ncbi:MAG: staygreen family protein [Candidatus Bathyarchaeota archaeon]|nr:MAG: staygreen family protein [Candidatus Bathyarchaeota archaeon]
MHRLNPEKLHTTFLPGTTPENPLTLRRYTLTHSDRTGELVLSVGEEYNLHQISGWYTRLMRDEVLAEWKQDNKDFSLHVYLHISGGVVFGRAHWRKAIFRRELPLVLEAIRYGDRNLFRVHPKLDQAPIHVHFQSSNLNHQKIEEFGRLCDYK